MRLGNNITTATFINRPSRFSITAERGGIRFRCFLPNPGRLGELLKPGATIAIDHLPFSPARKTRYDVVAAKASSRWVSIDSRVPNKLIGEALKFHRLNEFEPYSHLKPEVQFRMSRFDFLLEGDGKKCLIELKSCTLVRDGKAIFPDAPTARGHRHLLELIRAKRSGYRSCVMFVIQRDDAEVFTSNQDNDRDFSEALECAAKNGVELYARKCQVKNFDISIDQPVKLEL